jgi:hypothetical protein
LPNLFFANDLMGGISTITTIILIAIAILTIIIATSTTTILITILTKFDRGRSACTPSQRETCELCPSKGGYPGEFVVTCWFHRGAVLVSDGW